MLKKRNFILKKKICSLFCRQFVYFFLSKRGAKGTKVGGINTSGVTVYGTKHAACWNLTKNIRLLYR